MPKFHFLLSVVKLSYKEIKETSTFYYQHQVRIFEDYFEFSHPFFDKMLYNTTKFHCQSRKLFEGNKIYNIIAENSCVMSL